MFSRAMADILNACIVLAPCGGSGGGIYIYIYFLSLQMAALKSFFTKL